MAGLTNHIWFFNIISTEAFFKMATTNQGISESSGSEPRKSRWYFLNPNGRFSRKQFAFFYLVSPLILLIVYYVPGILLGILGQTALYTWLVACLLFMAYVVIIAGIRRLHDLNRSGWYLLLAFLPVMNVIMIIYLLAARGKVEGNRWAIK